MAALSDEPSIYHYVKEVSIRYALKEGGLEPQEIQQVLDHPAMNHPMLADIPKE